MKMIIEYQYMEEFDVDKFNSRLKSMGGEGWTPMWDVNVSKREKMNGNSSVCYSVLLSRAVEVNMDDTKLLDSLQEIGENFYAGSGGWVCRESGTGRGLRLHQSVRKSKKSIRDAIKEFIESFKDKQDV